jgi:hypothetical protein
MPLPRYYPSAKKLANDTKSSSKRGGSNAEFDRFALTKHLVASSESGSLASSGRAATEAWGDGGAATSVAFGSGSTSKGRSHVTTWRQQIDHIFVSVKDFARAKGSADAAKLQAQLMENGAIGAVTAAELRQDGDEVVFTVSFVDMSLNPRGVGGLGKSASKRKQEMSVQTDAPHDGSAVTLAPLADLGFGRPAKSMNTTARLPQSASGGWNKLAKALHFELGDRGEGSAETVMGLIDEGVDVNVADPASKQCALHVAAANGRTECIKFLLDANADINARGGPHGDTALHAAVRGQNPAAKECLGVLLDAGADATKKNIDMQTPAALAEQSGHSSLRSFLAARVGAPALAALAQTKRRP